MQTLVIAHAAVGHNHFFKNNYLFRQWTNADTILDYLAFAKDYVKSCEEQFGIDAVEPIVDAAHALMRQGVSHHPRDPRTLRPAFIAAREERRRAHEEETYDDLWRTLPRVEGKAEELQAVQPEDVAIGLPEENILYFLEKHAPRLRDMAARVDPHRAHPGAVFLSAAPDQLGSLKANLGHLDAAAGVAGLIKTVLALQASRASPAGQLPLAESAARAGAQPVRRQRSSGASVDADDGTASPRRSELVRHRRHQRPCRARRGAASRAGVASRRDAHLFCFRHARRRRSMRRQRSSRDHLERASRARRWPTSSGRCRRAARPSLIVAPWSCATRTQAVAALRRAAAPAGAHRRCTKAARARWRSSSAGRAASTPAWARGSTDASRSTATPSTAAPTLLEPHLGAGPARACSFDGDERRAGVDETRLAQPALFATEYALAALWRHWGVAPAAMLGHSIGEYVAAHLAGVFSLDDALALVAARGRLMQALPRGSMAAVHAGRSATAALARPRMSRSPRSTRPRCAPCPGPTRGDRGAARSGWRPPASRRARCTPRTPSTPR